MISQKNNNLSQWYNDVIEKAKVAEHGAVRGTMIIRPLGYAIWEGIQKNLDLRIKNLGARNVYFPLFIPYSMLEKEKTHVEGFSPELALVTIAGGEKLPEPLAVRPTSETIMYQAFSRWISSFRDLPLTINQWCNVVRWEKRPYLFLRTTEFLWQEGHSAHSTHLESQQMVLHALNLYVDVYQNVLGLFGFAGKKSETEKFAGALESYSYEILVPDGKVVQACTSHDLGQNFSLVFNVKFQNKEGKEEYVWQNSWGFSTRSMGPLIMVHGDDQGLVLPPLLAPLQVIIIPIISKSVKKKEIDELTQKAFKVLEDHHITVRIDNSGASPGKKFNQYDLEGVPVRVEAGATEINSGLLKVVRRDTKAKYSFKLADLAEGIEKILLEMQKDLLEKSKQFTLANTREAKTYQEFKEIMAATKGFIKAFWCEDSICEAKIKEETKASTRNLPLAAAPSKGSCVYCGKPATQKWLFGQSY